MANPPEGWPLYEIIEEPAFAQEVTREFGNHRFWDDVRMLIEMDIASQPLAFPDIPGTGIHFAELATEPPRIIVFDVDPIKRRPFVPA